MIVFRHIQLRSAISYQTSNKVNSEKKKLSRNVDTYLQACRNSGDVSVHVYGPWSEAGSPLPSQQNEVEQKWTLAHLNTATRRRAEACRVLKGNKIALPCDTKTLQSSCWEDFAWIWLLIAVWPSKNDRLEECFVLDHGGNFQRMMRVKDEGGNRS